MRPEPNPATAVLCHPWLDDEACDEVLSGLREEDFESGRILGPAEEGARRDRTVRSCGIRELPEGPLLDRIGAHLSEVNAATFRFDLDGFSAADCVTLLRYGPGDHFDWHLDNGVSAAPFATRKLGFTIQLSDPADYEGGDLEFAMDHPSVAGAHRALARRRGAIVVFAAFHLHRVSPVVRGVRLAIAGWLHGPAFR